ncbi:DUF4845 domain-containing protein [Pseudomonas stutzeri]|nr:DUF4845 domain-containing protein [Stutzerimonas stutzeri]
MVFARSQQGLSMLSWLMLLCVVGFLASVFLKVFPHYMDFYSLQKIIASAETESAHQLRSPNDFYSHVGRGMEVNNLDFELRKVMDVRMENNEFHVHLKYEKREPLIENLDLVVHFDREYRVRTP